MSSCMPRTATSRRGCWNAARYDGGISWAPGQGRRLEDPQGGEATGPPRLVTLRVDLTPPDFDPRRPGFPVGLQAPAEWVAGDGRLHHRAVKRLPAGTGQTVLATEDRRLLRPPWFRQRASRPMQREGPHLLVQSGRLRVARLLDES